MRALDRLPARPVQPAGRSVPALLLAALLAMVLATGFSSIARADPPPASCGSTTLGCLELDNQFGQASDPFTASYWFNTGGDACRYTTVQFSWDGGSPVSSPVTDVKDCNGKRTFAKAPTPRGLGPHTLKAIGCYQDPTSDTICDDYSSDAATYTIVSLTLKPTTGLASTDFSATYAMGAGGCAPVFPSARFDWDGTQVDGLVDFDATCRATLKLTGAPKPNGPKAYTIRAQACDAKGACTSDTAVSKSYTVKATPTPTPSPSPSPTPEPTATPVPTGTATPAPSEEVLGVTSEPRPSPTPLPAAVVVPSGPPDSPNSYVPAIVSSIGGPDRGSVDPAVVATNVLLTLLVLFLFGLTAEIFNSTMDANRDEVHGWWVRLFRGPLALLAALNVSGTSLGHLSGSGRIGSTARVLLILSLLGIIYGFLSPDFGWNPQSLILIVSLIVGLGFLTFFSEGSATRLATSRYRADASIKLYGTAIVVAILAVVVSRLVDFSPGLVYGFIASAVIVAPVALAKRDDATLVLVPAFGVLIVSLLAWLLLGPVRAAAAGGEPLPALAELILAMIVIGGLEGLFITMIPLTFLDGATVKDWSRLGWALVFGVVTFLWWQLLLNQDAAYLGAFEQTNVRVVLATLGVFMLTTGGLWSYFRFRPAPTEAEA